STHAAGANGHAAHFERERRLVHQVAGVGGGNGAAGGPDDGSGYDDYDRADSASPLYDETSPLPAHWQRPAQQQSARDIVRTALCAEARGGTLHVFMPPVNQIEEYLHLVSAVEQTAAELEMPVRIEGYGPPHDLRIQNFKV